MHNHIKMRILVIVLPVLLFVISLSYLASIRTANDIVNKEIKEKIEAEKEKQEITIEKKLDGARELANNLATFVGLNYTYESMDVYLSMLHSVVSNNSFLLGAGIWFEPYVYDKKEKYVGPYVYWNKRAIETTYAYSGESYDYFSKEYYALAKKAKDTIFTEVYYDETSGLYMMSCSTPIFNAKGEFVGCITADVELSSLQKLMSDYNTQYIEKAYIVGENGEFIAAENKSLIEQGSTIYDNENSSYHDMTEHLMKSESGEETYKNNGELMHVYYDTLQNLGWKIVFEVSDQTIKQPITSLSINYIYIFGIALLLCIAVINFVTAKYIEKPITALIGEFGKIGNNTYDMVMDSELKDRNDEFGAIGLSLQEMKYKLKNYQLELENSMNETIAFQEELIQQNEVLMENDILIRNSLNYSISLMEAVPDTVFVLSSEGIFLDCHGDIEHLFFKPEEFIGKRIIEIMPEEIAIKAMETIKNVLESGDTKNMEYSWSNRDIKEYHELRMVKWYDDKVIAIARNITEAHNYLHEIEYISFHDQVTGLHNRRFFDRSLNQMANKKNYPLSVVFSDLNGLKMINDSFGHGYGDEMLQKYANILMAARRNEDEVISRIGGDEFALLLPNTNEEEGEKIVRMLMNRCREESVMGMNLSVSFGYAVILDAGKTVEEALKEAEDKMYQNKVYESASRRSKTMEVILSTLHEKNPREEQHSRRVANICEFIAKEMGMPVREQKRIRTAGLLHDIGKIGIQEYLLNKPGRLTKEEYEEICRHSEIGYRILSAAPNMADIAEIILSHHERYDGAGYPKGIAGDNIPLYSRIVSIADTFDAMTSDRSYRKAMLFGDALAELERSAGSQFDPELVAFFVHHIEIFIRE